MRSALRALIWEQTRPILPVMAVGTLACAAFNALPYVTWQNSGDPVVSKWFSMGAIVAFFIVLLLTSADPNDLQPRFGARLYRLPVRTFTIVTTLFVLRIVLVTGEVVAILALGTWWTGGRFLPNHPDALLLNVPTVAALVATYAILQAIGWSVGNASTKAAMSLGLLLISIYVGGLMLMERWQMYRPEQDMGFPPLWLRELLRFIEYNLHRPGGLLACLAGAYAAIYAGVALDRRGWFQNPRSLRDLADSFSLFRLRSARRFKSAAAAQRWFEWRRMGLLLPGAVLVILAMSVLIPTVLEAASWPNLQYGGHYIRNVFVLQAGALFLGAILSAMVLPVLDRHDQRSGLARFIAVRPLSTWGIARARFEAGLLSVLLTLTALVVLSLGWTLAAVPAGKALTLWLTYPTYSVMRVATYLFWAAFLWGVLLMATTPVSALANKTVILIAVFDAIILGGGYALSNVAAMLATVAMTAIVAMALLLYRPAHRKGLIGADVIWGGIMGWLVLFVLYTAVMIPGSGTFESATSSDYLLAAALCTIPVAPLAGVPLAVHRWRHNQTGHKGWML